VPSPGKATGHAEPCHRAGRPANTHGPLGTPGALRPPRASPARSVPCPCLWQQLCLCWVPSRGMQGLNCPWGRWREPEHPLDTASGGCGGHSCDGADLGGVQLLSWGVCFKLGLQNGQDPLWLPSWSPCAMGISRGRSMASGRGLGQPELSAGHDWMETCSAVTSPCQQIN